MGIGIQVKSTTYDTFETPLREYERIIASAKKRNLLPVLALVFLHRKNAIRYYLVNKTIFEYKNGGENLRKLLEQV